MFNPFTFQPRLRPLHLGGSSVAATDVAWSSDGGVLYAVMPQPGADVASGVPEAPGEGSHAADGPWGGCAGELGGWRHFRGIDEGQRPRRSVLCALDVSDRSALRCTAVRDWGREGDGAPFSLEWRRDVVPSGIEAEGNAGCQGFSARFMERVAAYDEHEKVVGEVGEGAQARMRKLRLARWPGGLQSGVAMFRETVEQGSSLWFDRFEESLLACGRSELVSVLPC